MAPTGTIPASKLVTLFNNTCLAQYPDVQAVRTTFERAGLKDITYEEQDPALGNWIYSDDDGELSATIGTTVVHWSGLGGGGVEYDSRCEVSGILINPESIDLALEDLGTSLELDTTRNFSFDNQNRRGGILEHDGARYRIHFGQPIKVKRAQNGEIPLECNGVDRCRVWDRARLTIRPTDQ
ncbi:hypothetical protein SAMN05444003_2087 [Cognatiyoonia sediminum]|uniref:Uncharacterized protein n=1 Tax=Cognatiyoonia sediminum TaxID=1508389 RepID=A0A1M5Q6J1_9RHOB|nr:hypothetical protein [Cognatiyoonia sediminum]SHH09877.1 hypothetical protein SAMN05444003_2087 [Cognatiyoonia sediminum]